MKTILKNIITTLAVFLCIAAIFALLNPDYQADKSSKIKQIPISELSSEINNGKVASLEIEGNEIKAVYQNSEIVKTEKEEGVSFYEALTSVGARPEALKDIAISVKDASGGALDLLLSFSFLLPLIIFFVFFFIVIKQAKMGAGQTFGFLKPPAKMFGDGKEDKKLEKATFEDIAGIEEAKDEIKEVVDFLKNPKKYQALGAKIPRGVLLVGPPGVGKTLLARCVANEAKVPFFSMAGSEFIELFVGVGASRTRALFAEAKKRQPCLSGDTIITLSNGQEVTLQEMFDKKMVGAEVPAMTEFFKIKNTKVTAIMKRQKKEVFEINAYHTKIKATGNHLFPVLENGKIVWTQAQNLQIGDFLAAPRKINTRQNAPFLFEFLPKNARVYLKSKTQRKKCYISLRDWTTPDCQDIEKVALGRGGWTDSWLLKIPHYINEDILYTKGLIDSDGCFSKSSRSNIQFVNTEIILHQKLIAIMKENFAYEPKTYLNKKRYKALLPQGKLPQKLQNCYTTHINNLLIKQILQRIDECLLSLPENLIAAWVAGIFDGDGYCANANNYPKIVITSTKQATQEKIKSGLHRLGILGYSTASNQGGNIEITGKTNVKTFKEKVISCHPKKIARLNMLDLSGNHFWRLDQIPVGNLLKNARLSIGMGQRQFLHGNEISCWERNEHIPSRLHLASALETIETRVNFFIAPTREIEQLNNLCYGDIFFSKITALKKLPEKEVVYDLCLEEHHNFLANRMFVHNCIVFIDELDAIGKMRMPGFSGGHEEREQTLNQILSEMDGFEKNAQVIILAATNKPEALDPALLRPGRFDRRIVLDLPDIKGRIEILKIHTKDKPQDPTVALAEVAERTPGFSGADLANLVNEAAILTAKREKTAISQTELLNSIEKVLLGPERKSHLLSQKEKQISAYHEAGHALISSLLPDAEEVRKVSIVSRGMAAGYTLALPKEEKRIKTKKEFQAELAVLLAGYTAEELVFKELSTGASNDLEKASLLARALVVKYGMSKLGPTVFGKREAMPFLSWEEETERNYSEKTAQAIDKAIEGFIKEAKTTALRILQQKRALLNHIAKVLIEKETLEKEEFDNIVKTSKNEKTASPKKNKPIKPRHPKRT